MKQSRFTEQQIAFILHQAEEGGAVEEVCRKAGISIQTYYRWRKKYGGLAKWHNCVIGGQTADGRDATNALSYAILKAAGLEPIVPGTAELKKDQKPLVAS